MPLDITGYVGPSDLAPSNVNDLVQQAIADAKAGKWSDWVPREGQQEVILLELMASIVAADTGAFNATAGTVTEVMLQYLGLSRSGGTAAVVTVQFKATASPSPVLVPAQSMAVLDPGNGVDPLTFSTDTPLTLSSAGVGTVTATATRVGSEANGVEAGMSLQVLSALPWIDSAVTTTEVTSGTDPETDEDFLERGSPRFGRLSETLQSVDQFTAATLEQVGVSRAYVLDLYNPDGGTPGANPGHITVAVAGPGGSGLSSDEQTALLNRLQDMAYIMLTVHVINATVAPVNVTVTVVPQLGFTQAEVQTNVNNALAAYLNPDAWAWGGMVYLNEVIGLVDNVIGVDRVVNVGKLGTNTPGADYTLPGVAPLATVGTVVVNVQVM